MCDVSIDDGDVVVAPSGLEHTGGLVGPFRVALADIVEVHTNDDPASLVSGLKVGVGLPKTKIGTWHHDGVEDYFCVHHDGPAIVLDLKPGATYARVVVSVPDPESVAERIRVAADSD